MDKACISSAKQISFKVLYITCGKFVFLVDSALCIFQSTERSWCINCENKVSAGVTNDEIAVIACARISNLDEDEANKFAKFVFIATCDKIYYYKTKTSSTLRVYYIAFLRTPFFAVREHF